ncbi:MAG: CPBP family intramembrane metalloprotease [Bacteroidales bacterium]|nr:CPBP family intramembrane metalloprotease [Bacteroidales bacterium]
MNTKVINKALSAGILFLAVIPVFIVPLFGIGFRFYVVISAIMIVLTLLSFQVNKELSPTILFFTLVHVCRPINFWFTDLINISFPGTWFLIPILIFTVFILIFPQIRNTISWWAKEKINRNSLLIIVGLSVISAAALWVWSNYFFEGITQFTKILPDGPVHWMVMYGIGFAVFNSIAEEYLSRGMLCNGLEKLFSNKAFIILIQAIIFSVFHIHGFPGGISGMVMVFVWSLVLGWLRYRTRGLLGVLIGHFLADLSIYFILYELK